MVRRRVQSSRQRLWRAAIAAGAVLALFEPPCVSPRRIKDLASLQGCATTRLLAYGLVVGLDGSGDQTTQTPSLRKASSTCWRNSNHRDHRASAATEKTLRR